MFAIYIQIMCFMCCVCDSNTMSCTYKPTLDHIKIYK